MAEQSILEVILRSEYDEVLTSRTHRMRDLRDMIARANKVLEFNLAAPGSEAYLALRDQLDIPSFWPAVSAWLAAFDMPHIGITPGASANPDPRYKDKLPLFGSVLIVEQAPRIWVRLQEIGEEKIHIGEAADLMEQYAYLALAHLTINQPGAESKMQSKQATKAANARHSKAGGSRDKKKKICDVWASGKYRSRDICAEQECAAIGMSFSAARKALRGTPDPGKELHL